MRTVTRVVVTCAAMLAAACSHSAPVQTARATEASPPPSDTAAAPAPSATASPTRSGDGAPTTAVADATPAIAPPHHHHHHHAECGEVRVTFPSGSYALDTESEQRLDQYAACVESERARVLYVSGSTDPSGTEAENLVLARARGRAVADYLHSIGCHTEFEIHAVGEVGDAHARQVWPLERAAVVSDTRLQ